MSHIFERMIQEIEKTMEVQRKKTGGTTFFCFRTIGIPLVY